MRLRRGEGQAQNAKTLPPAIEGCAPERPGFFVRRAGLLSLAEETLIPPGAADDVCFIVSSFACVGVELPGPAELIRARCASDR